MSVSFDHLRNKSQVFDGKSFSIMDKDEAVAAQERGEVSITDGLTGNQVRAPEKPKRKPTSRRKAPGKKQTAVLPGMETK